MNSIGENIKKRRMELDMSVSDLAEKLGKNRATVYRYENGDIENMPSNVLVPIAKALHTTPAALLGIENKSEQESNYINKIPLLGKIACGEPITAIENIEEYVCLPDFIKADFALTAQGDSMINVHINDGDIVFIRKQPTVESGEIAAVLIDDEATLKRVSIHGDIIVLSPENPNYPQLVYKSHEVKILGKAVNYIGRVK